MEVAKGPDDTADQEFRRIVEMYQTSLLRMCSAQLQDSVLAEDAVQETFIKIYRSLPSFKKESGEKAWIMKIAVNTCRDMRRSKWFRYVDRRVTPDSLPDEQATIEETDDELTSAILNLSQKLREVVMLFYYQDMKLNEIAEILAVPVSTVASRLSRARKKLKDALERSDFDD
jgi:RNA polymerase sigma-70 factor (ECF subfamily)